MQYFLEKFYNKIRVKTGKSLKHTNNFFNGWGKENRTQAFFAEYYPESTFFQTIYSVA